MRALTPVGEAADVKIETDPASVRFDSAGMCLEVVLSRITFHGKSYELVRINVPYGENLQAAAGSGAAPPMPSP